MTLEEEKSYSNKDDLPPEYPAGLRELILACLRKAPEERPTSLEILAASIHHANWNSTFVSPYGGLISEDYTETLLSSWKVCQSKLSGPDRLPDLQSPFSTFSTDAVRVYLDNMGSAGDRFEPLFKGKYLPSPTSK
jgi:serine/threonine protein kinase